jgi:hypothetical protein
MDVGDFLVGGALTAATALTLEMDAELGVA